MALAGLKVIEFAGLAPGPFAGMVLADNGASVTRIDRPSSTSGDILCRGKRSIIIDSKLPGGRKLLEDLISSADILIDPFRPGVLERLGLGPDVFLGNGLRKGLNDRLIYARIVGFPRTGPQKNMAGHDINYIALSGILAMLPGTHEKPTFPLNLLADFAGGGLTSVVGILLALIERATSGVGQVVNADMVSGTRYIASYPLIQTYLGAGMLAGPRGTNILDGGAPFYDVYTCQSGGWMSVGCIEPQFFKVFIETFVENVPEGFDPLDGWKPLPATQLQNDQWPQLREYLTKGFLTRPRDFWTQVFHGKDACAVPVLTPQEAAKQTSSIPLFHPQLSSQVQNQGLLGSKDVIIEAGAHTYEVLKDFGLGNSHIRHLERDGVIQSARPRRPSKM
ncbi:CoA-transferase family III [Gymnopilus junonius]|uniref:CoA-transferase family III n=1 Tax=Gymnopilus junonius TaxID=109634 RepID=A0A9P5NV64_GYMJU|nr:CoA-transferase family III [Gymnopilus junonius]